MDKKPGTDKIQVIRLLTNGVSAPEAIDPGKPRFTWQIQARRRGVLQTAYRIVLTKALTGETLWDSGKVTDPRSASVEYTGPALTPDTAYHWRVCVWDQYGEQSPLSAPAHFRVGLGKEDWRAKDIWDGTENENNFAYFRKTFPIPENKRIAEAVVYTYAHNDYQLFLNGVFTGAGPARSDPFVYGQYCAYDVTDRLRSGDNVFAVLVHWHGVWLDSGVNAYPAYRLEARIRYTDGTTQTVITDESWKALADTAYRETDPVYFGFAGGVRNRASIYYDAEKEPADWKNPAFDDRGWQNATAVNREDYHLYAQLVAPQTEAERLSPVRVYRDGDVWYAEFAETISGWPLLILTAQSPGDEVRIRYWEVTKDLGDAGYDVYRCAGGEERFYAPFVRHTSFKLLEITGYKGELTPERVLGIAAYTKAENAGTFSCSDPLINAVYRMCERSARQNVQQGIISVDANREQSPWTADSWNIGQGILYNHRNSMLIDKILKDYAGEQQPDGNFLTCSPARQFVRPSPEWSMYWPLLLWQQYLFQGDTVLLRDLWKNLTGLMDYLARFVRENGLCDPPGWRISDYAGGKLTAGGENIVTNCQLYMDYQVTADVASLTDHPEEAQIYREKAEDLKNAVNRLLLTEDGRYAVTPENGQTHPLAAAWALRSGIVPDEMREKVIARLAQEPEYLVGGYGGDALYSGLYEADLGQIATADYVRYQNMLRLNNTNWESFGQLGKGNMGNHAWTAYPAYLLPKYVGGIRPVSGGFASVEIRPVIGGLTWADVCVPTIKGDVAVCWKNSPDGFTVNVRLPANVRARIFLPIQHTSSPIVTEHGAAVYANGSYLPGTEGVTDAVRSNTHIIVTAVGGEFQFCLTDNKRRL